MSITYTFEREIGAALQERTEPYIWYGEYAHGVISRFGVKSLWQDQAWLELEEGGV